MAVMNFAALTDRERRSLHRIMEAIGCLKCPWLKVARGRNANGYDCRNDARCGALLVAIEKLREAGARSAAKPEAGPAALHPVGKQGAADA